MIREAGNRLIHARATKRSNSALPICPARWWRRSHQSWPVRLPSEHVSPSEPASGAACGRGRWRRPDSLDDILQSDTLHQTLCLGIWRIQAIRCRRWLQARPRHKARGRAFATVMAKPRACAAEGSTRSDPVSMHASLLFQREPNRLCILKSPCRRERNNHGWGMGAVQALVRSFHRNRQLHPCALRSGLSRRPVRRCNTPWAWGSAAPALCGQRGERSGERRSTCPAMGSSRG